MKLCHPFNTDLPTLPYHITPDIDTTWSCTYQSECSGRVTTKEARLGLDADSDDRHRVISLSTSRGSMPTGGQGLGLGQGQGLALGQRGGSGLGGGLGLEPELGEGEECF